MDILVAPNLSLPHGEYAMSIKIFEYMASGKPIVLSNIEPHRQIFRNRVNALLFDPCIHTTLAEALITVFRKPKLARRLAKNAVKLVYRKYTWEERARRIERFATKIR